MTMLQFDACTIATVCAEAHLDFCLQGWVILPVGADIPREDQARGRFPREYAAPLTDASIVALLIPAATNEWLNHGIDCVRSSDLVVFQRPPGPHFLGEYA